jgi:hypothetical protein
MTRNRRARSPAFFGRPREGPRVLPRKSRGERSAGKRGVLAIGPPGRPGVKPPETPCEGVSFPLAIGERRLPALHWRRFRFAGPCFRVGADAFAPLIRAASAVLQPHRVQPLKAAPLSGGGRVPATSRVRGYEPRPRAPHPAPSSARLRKTPLVEQDKRTISTDNAQRSIVLDRKIRRRRRPLPLIPAEAGIQR